MENQETKLQENNVDAGRMLGEEELDKVTGGGARRNEIEGNIRRH